MVTRLILLHDGNFVYCRRGFSPPGPGVALRGPANDHVCTPEQLRPHPDPHAIIATRSRLACKSSPSERHATRARLRQIDGRRAAHSAIEMRQHRSSMTRTATSGRSISATGTQ